MAEQIYVPNGSARMVKIILGILAFMDGKARYITRFSVATNEFETLVEGENSELPRNPTYSPDGAVFIIFS